MIVGRAGRAALGAWAGAFPIAVGWLLLLQFSPLAATIAMVCVGLVSVLVVRQHGERLAQSMERRRRPR